MDYKSIAEHVYDLTDIPEVKSIECSLVESDKFDLMYSTVTCSGNRNILENIFFTSKINDFQKKHI